MDKAFFLCILMWSIATFAQDLATKHRLDYYVNDKKSKLPIDLKIKLITNNDTILLECKGKKFKIPTFTQKSILIVEFDNSQISAIIDSDLLNNNLEIKLEKYTNLKNLPKTRDGRVQIKSNTFIEIKDVEKIEKLLMFLFVQKDQLINSKTYKKKIVGYTKYIYK
ncbi:hypothetical protein [Flavobacterium sp.]|jgi:hypothetical protein|uniref:hypothetical protein n=1 Tax=Flavobacterium sp. TaxID=239 RepID=UPI0037C195E3